MKFTWGSIIMFLTTLNTVLLLSKYAYKTASIPFYNITFVVCCFLCAISFVLMLLDARWNKKNSDKPIYGVITWRRKKEQRN
jgi:hypothetical protein